MTCCALHNWLLHIDGLDENWESGVPSSDEGTMGELDAEDVPFAIQRLNSGVAAHETAFAEQLHVSNGSGNGRGSDQSDEVQSYANDPNQDVPIEEATVDGCRIVCKLPLTYFKGKLVEHFSILRAQGKLKWPKRLNNSRPTNI